MHNSSFMIAGTHSGCGKTTAAVAVLSALARRGLVVQAFKAGPDYIDPTYHNLACPNQRSRNLDLWLCDAPTVKRYFRRGQNHSEVSVVEGVMGLFDGKMGKNVDTSSRALSKMLEIPVILVIDAGGMAQSVGAYVHGFLNFDPAVRMAGIILNRISGQGHFTFLKDWIESHFSVPVLGYLPKDARLEIPERHLGLVPSLERSIDIQHFAKTAEQFININLLLEKTSGISRDDSPRSETSSETRDGSPERTVPIIRIAMAYDAAFHFYYEDALEDMREEGFEFTQFSPLKDKEVPQDADLLYLGGGFPEVFARELSRNHSMLQSLRSWIAHRKPVFGECGGLIYLTEGFRDKDGTMFPFIGAIAGKIRMTEKLQNFGYKEVKPLRDTFLFQAGEPVRVHEFHYSSWEQDEEAAARLASKCAFETAGSGTQTGYWDGQILASYYHCHLGAYPKTFQRLRSSYEIQAH